ncbi:unnamed protein product [Diatraea saccharalis]|uniref:C2H2-type domain-containing protein n=1 Tax=Diatraea saccharalis TaxID=40085 RepID=A0A9P0G418_9NEOP|nr:unnamed protein product [Diatraea saccharalis]
MHVKEKQHIRNKAIEQTKRFGRYVVVYDSILIDHDAWSGMMRDSCAVCNVEAADKNLHKSSTSHILKLIHNTVEFGPSEEIYREVDDSTFYCITCNAIFATNAFDVHFNETEHNSRLKKCKKAYLAHKADVKKEIPIPIKLKSGLPVKRKEKKNIRNNNGFASDSVIDEASDLKHFNNDDKGSTLLNSTHIFAKNEVNVNFEYETAFCKKCFENVNFDYDSIVNHIKEHDRMPKSRNVSYVPYHCEVRKQNSVRLLAINSSSTELDDTKPNVIDSKGKNVTCSKKNVTKDMAADDPVVFAKENRITYNKNNSTAHCQICEANISSSLRSMKEHVAGSVHKILSSKKVSKKSTVKKTTVKKTTAKKTVYSKLPMKDFIEELFTIRNFTGKERIINDKYCIDHLSFLVITETGRSLRCQVCEVNLTLDQVNLHGETSSHVRAMGDTLFLTSLDDTEFVREVRMFTFLFKGKNISGYTSASNLGLINNPCGINQLLSGINKDPNN